MHAPWCRSRCPYCSFVTWVNSDPPWRQWADGVLDEWRRTRDRFEGSAHSLYLGGGTPSLAPAEQLRRIIATVPLSDGAEVTVETNPATVTAPHLQRLLSIGVNRLSLGVQTFNERFARQLGRGHTVAQAAELIARVRDAGFDSWSLDLMFALPGQTLDELRADVDRVLQVEPPHVSLYGLTVYPGTPLAQTKPQLPDDDLWHAMYEHIVDTLGRAGLHRYEVSNFALPGHRAVHNEAVWRGGHYAGLGPSARGFHPDGLRTTNSDDWGTWRLCIQEQERPTPHQAAVDFVLSTLRHAEGIPLDAIPGFELDLGLCSALAAQGVLVVEPHHVRLAHDGFPLADGLTERLCRSLRPRHA